MRFLFPPQFGYLGFSIFWILGIIPLSPETESHPVSPPTITLNQAYERVLDTDQTIKTAFLEIQKAKLLPWSALTRFGPRLTGNASYQNQPSSSLTTSSGRVDNKSAGITYEQPLLDFTAFPAYRLGKLTSQASSLQHQLTIRETLFGVAKAYYEVLKQQQLLKVNQETRHLAEQQLDLAQKRYDVGEVTRTDVSRARVAVETARRTELESTRSVQSTRTTLRNILNLDRQTDFQVTDPPPLDWMDEPFETVLQRALEKREDYTISSLTVEQDIARKNEIIGQYGPTLVAQITEEWNSPGSGRSDTDWRAGLALQFPFFEGGQREIDLQTADRQIAQTRLAREKLAKSIEEEVKNAWLQADTLHRTIEALRAQVEAAEQNYQDLQVQYEAGAATSLDTLVALRDLNSARTDLSTQIYDYQVALRDLQRSTAQFQEPHSSTPPHDSP